MAGPSRFSRPAGALAAAALLLLAASATQAHARQALCGLAKQRGCRQGEPEISAPPAATPLAVAACPSPRLLYPRRELMQGQSTTAALDAALDSPLEGGSGRRPGGGGTSGGGGAARPPQTIVGATCSSTGPANVQGCCERKALEGTCQDDPSCVQPMNRCPPPPGQQCSSRGPSEWRPGRLRPAMMPCQPLSCC